MVREALYQHCPGKHINGHNVLVIMRTTNRQQFQQCDKKAFGNIGQCEQTHKFLPRTTLVRNLSESDYRYLIIKVRAVTMATNKCQHSLIKGVIYCPQNRHLFVNDNGIPMTHMCLRQFSRGTHII